MYKTGVQVKDCNMESVQAIGVDRTSEIGCYYKKAPLKIGIYYANLYPWLLTKDYWIKKGVVENSEFLKEQFMP